MPYCTKDDLLIGDIRLASKYGDGSTFVQLAADEIDAQIGHIYKTPVSWVRVDDPADRPAKLLLKKINQLLASARIILDQAAGGEDSNLHAYGRSMLREATQLLEKIQEREIILHGAELLDNEIEAQNNAVTIIQDDPYSLVEGFYSQYGRPAGIFPNQPMRAYDDRITP